MDINKTLAKEFGLKQEQVDNTVALIDDDKTIPFIARYRKELTGSLDDQILRELYDRLMYLRNLEKRKEEVTNAITEQEKMTPEIEAAISAAVTLVEVEDIYRPFKPKRRTRASIARENGLEPLAVMLIEQKDSTDPEKEAEAFIDEEKKIKDAQTALQGAMDIIAEDISDDADIRKKLRALAGEKGELVSKASDPEAESVYMNYYEYSEAIPKVANHRVLALDRGEKEGFLKVAVTLDETIATDVIFGKYIKANNSCGELVRAAAADSYKRLIFPSIEREIRSEMSAKAAEESIKVFAANLRQMLLQPPLKSSVILGLDPGYAHGCKTAVIDGTGKVLDTAIIYPVGSAGAVEAAKKKVKEFIQKYNVNVISIGNGTASRETESFAAEIVKEVPQDVSYMVVSEAGASVYSASKVAAEEFPEYDVSIRGAISIARRLQDPLAELVKIDPKAIGVGQYQHDMPQARMSEALGGVVEDCVNSVGVDLNTASHSLLSYIAGINATVAKNIVTYREENGRFTDRKELLKVPKLGKKAFEQCAGFLRVRDGKNPLDNTAVHPESYEAASSLLSECGFTIADIAGGGAEGITEKAENIGIENISKSLGIGVPTLTDIIGELKKPGRDLRDELPAPLLRSGDVMEIKDLKPGMELVGTVRNIIDFGCFVDIGVHEDGLVHISQICSRYIKHPLEAVKVGEVVKVRVLDVDLKRNRISLTMRLNDEEEKKQQKSERRPNNRKREDRKPKGFDASQLRNSSFRIKQK
ncbi:Tex family protein [Ruminococcus flavefaciens]|uniref:Tex family protein n=1 Tax=Ruminococcus flavefaciens TaxID=1265 RepID=UPI0026EA13FE|nr:Tex family protein [Ruminococcus flavefaciens]MDD7515438.1 Tex family protein [Ruminococcus flavefaciens]MDY5690230.1 Tex family protein [Ruminococcus flavefaciens]